MNSVLAADLGGTKILAACVHADGRCAEPVRRSTPAAQGAAAVVEALAEALQAARQAAPGEDLRAIGLSLAGVIDRHSARVLDATDALPGWKGTDLRAALQDRLGLPVFALNDVHAALRGEAWRGGLQGAERGALITLGTGLGGAWLAEGQLQTGAHQLAGHFGRTQVLHEGRRVPLEELVSGSALARWHGAAPDGHAVLATLDSDPRSRDALRRWTEQLALLLHNLHWSLDPGRVLIGGGLIEARALWWDGLLHELRGLPLQVEPAQLGALAGLYGAAREALDGVRA
ncbi:ROK family protein [Inhella sp.]|uniref:ROK family protein n=1 Tax=Inhella sp. TaxID=1921806 RepID=UPI0035AF72EB